MWLASSLADQNYSLACTFDGRPSAGLAVFQLPGTNALTVGNQIRAKMEELKPTFPDGVEYADRLRHHALHPRVGRRRGADAVRGGRCWSAWSCWSSCRTGGRR